ncbi:hypothetical protein PRZ61_10755 [Halomonas pacifica]|uniref:hypothetical protein n=1 Tax=Bisbaumannia pacifica TaxID=77098 RepID=UPI0023594754|nr:hypothetical protein [Halomonas pacifica]MDC8803915.1 hypothetical protein [Halomonas pacifica]
MTRSHDQQGRSIWCEHEGYVMRSLAEKRVAQILSRLGISWLYEHMPYDFHGYLPDFYLPHLDVFVEVKGEHPTDEEQEKCRRLHSQTGAPVVLVYGEPNIFMHRPDTDSDIRPEVGWLPYLFFNGIRGRIRCNLICQAIYATQGESKGLRYVSAFNVSKESGAMHIRCCLVEMIHRMDPHSKAIYQHNGPVSGARLKGLGEPSGHERFIAKYIAERKISKEAA